jgi:endonuclease/exonuclease/phosphatase family metal-dependent hydrolase
MRILSYNLYFGFDGRAAQERPALGLAQFQATDAPARMWGLARFLAERRPEVAALQEVARLALPEKGVVVADLLESLRAALQEAGGPQYKAFVAPGQAAAARIETDGEAREFLFEEDNVLLVAPGLDAEEVRRHEYRSLAPRGLRQERHSVQQVRVASAEMELDVYHTHLEAFDRAVREAQARELVQFIEAGGRVLPAVLLGDLNAPPESEVHRIVSAAGFEDTFRRAGAGPGATCCQEPLLQNERSLVQTRIDYVFVRAGLEGPAPEVRHSEVVLTERVPRSGGQGWIWPSDHFGVLSDVAIHRRS